MSKSIHNGNGLNSSMKVTGCERQLPARLVIEEGEKQGIIKTKNEINIKKEMKFHFAAHSQ